MRLKQFPFDSKTLVMILIILKLQNTPGVNVINLFPSLLMMKPNKLECFYLAITFQYSLTFAGNTRSLPEKEVSGRRSR
jgi:hypothetical protein